LLVQNGVKNIAAGFINIAVAPNVFAALESILDLPFLVHAMIIF